MGSNEMGAGRGDYARRSAYVGLILSVSICGILVTGILLGGRLIGRAFSPDPELIDIVATLMPMLAIYVFMDGVCAIFSGVLSGTGRQRMGAARVIFAYYVVGIPVSYTLAFPLKWGVYGLVWGRVAGKVVQVMLYGWITFFGTDWEKEVARAREMVKSTSFNSFSSRNKLAQLDDDTDSEDEGDNVSLLHSDV